MKDLSDRMEKLLILVAKIKKEQKNQGTIECPICNGNINYVINDFNGHTKGACETKGCLNWIE